jgi:hypothetical protein
LAPQINGMQKRLKVVINLIPDKENLFILVFYIISLKPSRRFLITLAQDLGFVLRAFQRAFGGFSG